MTRETRPDRRAVVGAGLAAGAVVLTGRAATAQQGRGLPDNYPGNNARQFQSFMRHENAHVAFLQQVLGPAARPKPNFQGLEQADVRAFATTALNLENTGSGAYVGAAPFIFSRRVLEGALSIAEIEGRHCGYLNTVFNRLQSQNVFAEEQNVERALTQPEVRDLAGPFIRDLNGGPPLEFGTVPSRQNDIAILNFALALEYLEAEYYNINVPKFFGNG